MIEFVRRTFATLVASVAVATASAGAAEPTPGPSVTTAPSATPEATPPVPPAPTVSAVASASPSASASPTASPSVAPTATPSGPIRPLRLDRTRVGIVPGGSYPIAVFGGAGTIGVRSSNANVDATYDPLARRATLVARTAGTAVVTVFDAAGQSAEIAVLVAPAAGVVPSDVTVELGGIVSSAFAAARIEARIARDAQLQPGTKIDIHGIALASSLGAGTRVDTVARVKIDGGGTFVDALGTTNVHLRVDAYPKLDPQLLLYSDDPERLDAAADGVLYRANVAAGQTARAYIYHVSDTPNRRIYLALQATGAPARVQMLGYTAGPENAFSFVGHRATLQYLLERGAQESVIVDVPADAPTFVPLPGRAMRAGDLIASIFDLRALEGGAFTASVVAVSDNRDPLEVIAGPELAGDGHGRRGEFSLLDVPALALAYSAGGPEPAPFAVGAPTLANLRAGGRALGGDYGVLRGIALQLTNPTATQANVYLYESPAGGNATTTMWFAGDPAPTEVACVKIPSNRYAIKTFALAPNETRVVTGEYMTDGTSYFPLIFGLSATPPSPPPGPYSPDACTPKAPPPGTIVPSPSPSPSSSPSQPASPAVPTPGPVPSATAMPVTPAATARP